MTNLAVAVPDELVETIAQRAAAIVLERTNAARSEPLWLTFEQAGERLGCSADAVRMRAKRGRLETRHVGRRVYISRASVDGAA
jgi:excisionase family DNA binding protein